VNKQRVIERRTSSSDAGGESVSPGQRSITSAFEVGKVHATSIEGALKRWIPMLWGQIYICIHTHKHN